MHWAGGKLGSEAAGPGLNPTLYPASGWPQASHLARANPVFSFVKKTESTRMSCLGSKVAIRVRSVCALSSPGKGSAMASSVSVASPWNITTESKEHRPRKRACPADCSRSEIQAGGLAGPQGKHA